VREGDRSAPRRCRQGRGRATGWRPGGAGKGGRETGRRCRAAGTRRLTREGGRRAGSAGKETERESGRPVAVTQARKRRGGLWVGADGARAVRRWRRGVGHGRGREGEGHGAGKEILDRELAAAGGAE
jgi:hypothetical protein